MIQSEPHVFLYEKDINSDAIRGRKLAVLGYGSQGRSQALILRDRGLNPVVAQRSGSRNHQLALEDGFYPVGIEEAVKQADFLIMALPDEAMGEIFLREIAGHLRHGNVLGFLHGFAIRFEVLRSPSNTDIVLVAPKGPGPLVRDAFVRGGGLPCMVAVHQDHSGKARELALAWAATIGGGRAGILETTFAQECEADLFGEQTVLCGGIIELMKTAFDVAVAAGIPPEVAYFECVHEVKQIVDMHYTSGLAGMRAKISRTASYGGLTRGPRLVTEDTRRELQSILAEIQSGAFAKEWLDECRAGRPKLRQLESQEASHPCEAAGKAVREAAQASIRAVIGQKLADQPEGR